MKPELVLLVPVQANSAVQSVVQAQLSGASKGNVTRHGTEPLAWPRPQSTTSTYNTDW